MTNLTVFSGLTRPLAGGKGNLGIQFTKLQLPSTGNTAFLADGSTVLGLSPSLQGRLIRSKNLGKTWEIAPAITSSTNEPYAINKNEHPGSSEVYVQGYTEAWADAVDISSDNFETSAPLNIGTPLYPQISKYGNFVLVTGGDFGGPPSMTASLSKDNGATYEPIDLSPFNVLTNGGGFDVIMTEDVWVLFADNGMICSENQGDSWELRSPGNWFIDYGGGERYPTTYNPKRSPDGRILAINNIDTGQIVATSDNFRTNSVVFEAEPDQSLYNYGFYGQTIVVGTYAFRTNGKAYLHYSLDNGAEWQRLPLANTGMLPSSIELTSPVSGILTTRLRPGFEYKNAGFTIQPSREFNEDAAGWFSLAEVLGFNFGPSNSVRANNLLAFSNWVVALKESGAWAKLTAPGVGYIKPLIWTNSHLAPALFGSQTVQNFVSGDHNPATGLTGSELSGKVILPTSLRHNSAPQNDFFCGVWAQNIPSNATTLFGGAAADGGIRLVANGAGSYAKGEAIALPSSAGATGRLVALNRRAAATFQHVLGPVITPYANASIGNLATPLSFFGENNGGNSTASTFSILLAGLSLTDSQIVAVQAATAELIGAGRWS